MQKDFQKMPLFLTLGFFIFSCFVFLFFYRQIINNKIESQQREMEWQTEASRREEIKTLDRSVRIIEPERTQLETHFAQSSDIVPFLDTIEGLALKAGSNAEIVSVDIPKDSVGLMVGVKASGTFENLYKFLTLLENSPYELEFVSMNIRKETGVDLEDEIIPSSKWNNLLKIKLLSFVQ